MNYMLIKVLFFNPLFFYHSFSNVTSMICHCEYKLTNNCFLYPFSCIHNKYDNKILPFHIHSSTLKINQPHFTLLAR